MTPAAVPPDPLKTIDDSEGIEAVEAAEIRSEARDYLAARTQRRHLLPRAALVGFLAGLVALLFRLALDGAQRTRLELLGLLHGAPVGVGMLVSALLSGTFAAASVFLVRKAAPEAAGSGIPHLEAVLRRYRTLAWKRVLPVKFVGGVLAIGGAGLVMGREGPTVQMGGSVGAGVADALGSGLRERETLMVAGAGAGLAAAFNAPLSGLVFVVEEVQREFTPAVFGAALIATVIADVVARVGGGQAPVFRVPAYPPPPLASLLLFGLLGAGAGLLGVVFNRVLMATLNRAAALGRRVPAWISAGMVGLVIGGAGFWRPEWIGSGHPVAETALAGKFVLAAIPLLLLVRFVFTMASYGTGAAGGIFAPLLALGALLGLALGQCAHQFSPTLAPLPGAFAVVGMAAYFAAVVRAPLTGIVLIIEMTGSYDLMLPLLVGCFSAYAVAEALANPPLYEALLERDLASSGHHTAEETPAGEPKILDLRVGHEAAFAGRKVRDLGLPPGCVLVTVRRRDGEEGVVTAETVLREGDHLVAVIAPQASRGEALLRDGLSPNGG